MKRLFLIIALLYSSLSVYSQTTTGYINNNTNYSTSKSSRGEDTLFMGVEYRDPRYIYGQNWVDECIFESKNQGTEAGYGPTRCPGKVARRIYTDTSLSIIGLAVAATMGINEGVRMNIEAGIYTLDQCYADTSVANRLPEYVQLYEVTDTSFELVAQGRWDDPNNKPIKKLELIDKPSRGSIKHIYAPIYEVYFDSAVVVNDSFYREALNLSETVAIGRTFSGILNAFEQYESFRHIGLVILRASHSSWCKICIDIHGVNGKEIVEIQSVFITIVLFLRESRRQVKRLCVLCSCIPS